MPDILLLGVDAGGTKTIACAYTPDGEIVARVCGAAGNITADPTKGCRVISDTLAALLSCLAPTYSAATLPFLCVGAAGATAHGEHLQRLLTNTYGGQIAHIRVVSDALLSLYAAHGTKDGILVISGTGSIAYRKSGNTLLRCGGWGHLLSDEGSGYDIAIQAIRAVTEDEDTDKTAATALRDAIYAQLGIDSLPQLISYVYSHSKGEIASLATVVSACAAQGDPTARGILQAAGEQLAAMVATLFSRQPVIDPLPVALSGGVLRGCDILRAATQASLQARALPISRTFELTDATVGVLALYREFSARPS